MVDDTIPPIIGAAIRFITLAPVPVIHMIGLFELLRRGSRLLCKHGLNKTLPLPELLHFRLPLSQGVPYTSR